MSILFSFLHSTELEQYTGWCVVGDWIQHSNTHLLQGVRIVSKFVRRANFKTPYTFTQIPGCVEGCICMGNLQNTPCLWPNITRGFLCLWCSNSFESRVEFLLKTDSGYPRDAKVTLFTLANPEHSLRSHTHWSAPPVSALARSGGPRKMSQSLVSHNLNIERRMDRPRPIVGVIRGVA